MIEKKIHLTKALPNGWVNSKLSDFGTLYCGQSPSVAEVNSERRGVAYITGPDQWDGYRLRIDKWTEHPKRSVPYGCIFITVKGAGVGKTFPGVEGAIGRDIYAFQPHSALDYKYVFYALKFSIDQLIIQAQGDIPGLSKSHILDHRIGLPGIQEQQRISSKIEELFSELDQGVAILKTAREQLKVHRQALLTHAFEGKLTSRWRGEHEKELQTTGQILNRITRERDACYQQRLEEWKLGVKNWQADAGASQKPPRPKPLPDLAVVSLDDVAELNVLPRGYVYTYLSNLGDLARGKSKHGSIEFGVGEFRTLRRSIRPDGQGLRQRQGAAH